MISFFYLVMGAITLIGWTKVSAFPAKYSLDDQENAISNDIFPPYYVKVIPKSQMAPPVPPLDVPELIRKFRLKSLKPLLAGARLPNQPSPQELQARLMAQNRWTIIKDGQVYTLLNNQMVPLEIVTDALVRSNLAPSFMNQRVFDAKLIEKLKQPKRRPHSFPELDNHLDGDDFVGHLAPNFDRFPRFSQRFRLSTLGMIGYDRPRK